MSENDPARHEVTTFTDVVGPADDYRAGHPIVVHVVADTETGRRIIDFMSGLAYGREGDSQAARTAARCPAPANTPVARRRLAAGRQTSCRHGGRQLVNVNAGF